MLRKINQSSEAHKQYSSSYTSQFILLKQQQSLSATPEICVPLSKTQHVNSVKQSFPSKINSLNQHNIDVFRWLGERQNMQPSPPQWAGEGAAAGSSQVALPELSWSTAKHSEDKYTMCCPNATAMWPNTGNIFKFACLQVSSQKQLCHCLLANREMTVYCLLSARWAKWSSSFCVSNTVD